MFYVYRKKYIKLKHYSFLDQSPSNMDQEDENESKDKATLEDGRLGVTGVMVRLRRTEINFTSKC